MNSPTRVFMLKQILSFLILTQLGFAQTKSPVATFSILAYDPETGMIGGAVQSRVFSVGNGVLWAEADIGIVATQAYVDVSYGPKGLKLLEKGLSPDEVVKSLLKDEHPEFLEFIIAVLYRLAHSDSIYSQSEDDDIREVAKIFDIQKSIFEKILEFFVKNFNKIKVSIFKKEKTNA